MADVDICNRALLALGSRSKITALTEDTDEAQTLNMVYTNVRDQILAMAPWNFARKTTSLNLVKAAPGTPLSPIINATQWISSYPAPPWAYEYALPSDSVGIRYVIPQPGLYSSGVPIFSTPQYTYAGILGAPPQRFIIATDSVGPVKTITAITKANPGVITSAAHGFSNGDIVYLTSIIGMVELNGTLVTVAGAATNTFQLSGVDTTSYTTYVSNGVAVNQTQTTVQQNVLLTDAAGAVVIYSQKITDTDLWDPQSRQALVSALAGFIALPLTGDKNLVSLLLGVANKHILDARVSDGNEGLTMQDHMPDWISARTGEGSSNLSFFPAPYPPLFAVA